MKQNIIISLLAIALIGIFRDKILDFINSLEQIIGKIISFAAIAFIAFLVFFNDHESLKVDEM